MIQKEFYVQLQVKQQVPKNVGAVVQNDINGNRFMVSLIDGVNPVDITGYTTITFTVQKPDNTYYVDSLGDRIVVIDPKRGELSIILGTQAVTKPGLCQAVIEVWQNNIRITSAKLVYLVVPDISYGADPTSESDYPALLSLMSQLSSAEGLRVIAEDGRVLAETGRVNAETAREQAETARQANELIRQSQEVIRQTNEELRKQQEDSRQASIEDIESRFYTLTAEQQQDAEVIDARKGKASLREKIDEIDGYLGDIAINVKQFGAKGDGVTDDTQAFLDMTAFCNNRSYTKIYIPKGIYKINQQITINSNVTIYGDNENETILDFSTSTGDFPNNACLLITGDEPQALPAITADIVKNDNALSFANTPNLNEGDIITILDATLNSWSGYREYYRKGEMAKVISVNDLTVTLDNPFYDSYENNANLKINKLNMIMANVSKIGFKLKMTTEVGQVGLLLRYCKNAKVTDITGSGTNYAHVSLNNCYNTILERINIDYSSPPIGYNYGIGISNSHKIHVNKCSLKTERHGLAIGGNDTVTAIINREIIITDCFIGSYGYTGADMHGNVEYIYYKNCVIENGVIMAGNNTEVKNCNIKTDPQGIAIYFGEVKGMNHNIINNDITCPIYTQSASVGNGVIRCSVGNNINKGGTLNIKNNKFNMLDNGTNIGINNQSQIKFNLIIENNEIERELNILRTGSGLNIRGLFNIVKINNNYLMYSDINITDINFSLFELNSNTIINSCGYGIYVGVLTENDFIIDIKNNKIIKSGYAGVAVRGNKNVNSILHLKDNIIIDSSELGLTSSTATDTNFFVSQFKLVEIKNNTIGDTRITPKQRRLYALDNIVTLFEENNNDIGNLQTKNISSITNNYVSLLYTQDTQDQTKRIKKYDTAPPVDGDWTKGSIIYNLNPSIGNPIGWVCVESGTPGTWKGFGLIET